MEKPDKATVKATSMPARAVFLMEKVCADAVDADTVE